MSRFQAEHGNEDLTPKLTINCEQLTARSAYPNPFAFVEDCCFG